MSDRDLRDRLEHLQVRLKELQVAERRALTALDEVQRAELILATLAEHREHLLERERLAEVALERARLEVKSAHASLVRPIADRAGPTEPVVRAVGRGIFIAVLLVAAMLSLSHEPSWVVLVGVAVLVSAVAGWRRGRLER